MSRRKREAVACAAAQVNTEINSAWKKYTGAKQIRISAGILMLAVIGVIGAYSEKYKNSFAAASESSAGANSAPIAPAAIQSATPQLSKEYIYAGGRMLAVEDKNASAVPPADLAVWRPTTGYWYVMGAGGSLQASAQWGTGTANDVTVPGDYDGDAKTDFSVYRPGTGYWYILRSTDNTVQTIFFGNTGDSIAPADYDGDGRTDAAVFRPSNQYWYIQKSSDGVIVSQQFGNSTDIPASADYDGDGKADIGVWRSSSALFASLNSTNNQMQVVSLGQSNDQPMSGDYDGDGKADYALYRAGSWIIKQSTNNQTNTTSWGNSTDTPVPNDYDADGKLDLAVWRGTSQNSGEIGNWYIVNSSTGQPRYENWGIAGDKPVPAFYRRLR